MGQLTKQSAEVCQALIVAELHNNHTISEIRHKRMTKAVCELKDAGCSADTASICKNLIDFSLRFDRNVVQGSEEEKQLQTALQEVTEIYDNQIERMDNAVKKIDNFLNSTK